MAGAMPSPLVLKLEHGADLTAADRAYLESLSAEAVDVEARVDLVGEGEIPEDVHVVLAGFACRYKMLPDGGRQITAWLTPGDFCDLHVAVIGEMDHAIATLTPSRIGRLPRDGLDDITDRRPALARAFWWATLVDEAVLREWLVNLGRRAGDQRVAHLFCELLARLKAVGLARDDVIDFPLTQIDLADTVGLSAVHVNRIVQQLRENRLIAWRSGKLRILEPEALAAFAEFNPAYLHLAPARRGADRAV